MGSFLNCVIYRLEKKEKITGRSYCPKCSKQLKWYDLFPVLSFLFLGGKCRYCKEKISIQYPLVEMLTGLIFLLIFNFVILNFINNVLILKFLNAGFLFYIASALIVIFVYDLKHYLIPDKVLFPAILLAFIFSFQNASHFINSLLAAAIASGFFLAIFLISGGRWMGFGDVKFAVLMGLLLGFPNVLMALFLAFFFGAIISVILMILGKRGLKSEIPFGPFLIAGTFLSIFWGEEIMQWYLRSFLI